MTAVHPVSRYRPDLLLPSILRAAVSRAIVCLFALICFISHFASAQASSAGLRASALAYEQQGQLADAESAWRAYGRANPSSPEPWGHLALLAARQEHYQEAIPLYRKALAMKPEVPGLRLDLGLALFKNGDLKASIAEFNILLGRTAPGSPQALRLNTLIGLAHYGLGQYAAAAPYLKKAAAGDPRNLSIRLALAHSYLWTRQTKNVLDVYREILTIDPDSAEADMLAGEALDQMQERGRAAEMFRSAIKANPRQPDAHFALGYLLWIQKSYSEAAVEFRAELANDPDHFPATLYLADADIQLNQLAEARSLLERAVQMNSAVPLVHLDLGIVYSEAGENDRALQELTLAERQNPQDVNVHWRLGRLYRTLGRKQEAKAEFDKASSLNKATDVDLYRKIAEGRAKAPPPAAPAASAP